MTNRKDPAWKYGVEVELPNNKGKGYKYIECNFCKKIVKGGVKRMKDHLVGTHSNVAKCDKVPDDVKQEIKDYLTKGGEERNKKQRENEEKIDTGSYYTSVTSQYRSVGGLRGSSTGSASARGVRGPMDRFVIDVDDDKLNDEGATKSSGHEKELRNQVCLDIGRFFFENGIPVNVANSPSFVNMCRSLGHYGRGFKPPTSYELSTWILKEEEKTTQTIVDEVKKTWVHTGVSILSDGWKDARGRSLINFLVNNPHGTIFFRSVDASDAIKDANLMFKLLDEVVEEVGEDLVIQVVTDNASNYKSAGKMLMEKRTRLWWTPCAAHCIDLMLEKLGNLPHHTNALIKAKKVSHFIYNHGWVLVLMRKHANRELIRPAATRFATSYLTLQSMYGLRQPLEAMFTSKEWANCSWAHKAEGKEVKKIILRDQTFWNSVAYAIKTTKPLVSVLRMTDSEKMPGMRFIYGAMDKAKEEIASNLDNEEGAYKEIWSIIDDKWEFQLHRHLHVAAYFLNPHFQYDDNFSTHPEIKLGLYTCMDKLIPDPVERERADLQVDAFRRREGLFGFAQAKATCKKRSPAAWWSAFGDKAPELTAFAIKILSLTCSSSACERNWSTFNQIHTKKRNRLATSRLNSLVFIMYNKRLKDMHFKKMTLKGDEDPLVVNDVPSDDEWIVDQDECQSHSSGSGVIDDVDVLLEGGARIHENESNQERQRKKRKSKQSKTTRKDKGKRLQLVDEEKEWEDLDTDEEDDRAIRYADDSLEDPSSDDDGGDDYDDDAGYDPFFRPLETSDPPLII